MSRIKLFSRFIEENNIDFLDNTLYVYYIGRPTFESSNEHIKNVPKVPILIRATKTDKIYKFNIDWHTLPYHFLGQNVLSNGKGKEKKKIANYRLLVDQDITILHPRKSEILSLSELKNETKFYKNIECCLHIVICFFLCSSLKCLFDIS